VIAAHFAAVRELLEEAAPDIPVHDTDASAVVGDPEKYPFIVLSGGTVRGFSESLGGCEDGAQALIRVTHTALAPAGVRELVDISRAALVVPGRYGWELVLDDSQDVEPDRDVRPQGPATSAFPFYAVDIYRLGSTRFG
jgi:hypothetical protein